MLHDVEPDQIALDTGTGAAERRGADALVEIAGLEVARPALSLDLGNPHTVVMLAEDAELDAADLTRPPVVDPLPLEGTNVEPVVPVDAAHHTGDPAGTGRLRMRVHERGVGETLSCGTGVCAAALAARTWAGAGAPEHWLVEVAGGTLAVRTQPGGRVELAGPARIVAGPRGDGFPGLSGPVPPVRAGGPGDQEPWAPATRAVLSGNTRLVTGS